VPARTRGPLEGRMNEVTHPWEPQARRRPDAPKTSMRQAQTVDSGMERFVANLGRLRDARSAILVASSFAVPRHARVRHLSVARVRPLERSVKRSRERSPERSSPPELSSRKAAGKSP
jgi:hypothetical protein